jgi:sugar phosphate isomerase/epimerase
MMQLGFVSAVLPDASLEEVLETASRLGYDCVELMCWPVGISDRRYAGVTHLDVANCGDARLAEVRELIDRYGVSISGLGYYPNPLSPDVAQADQAAEHIRRIIETAPKLGVRQVNSFVGRDPAKSIDDNWQPFLDRWSPLVELAEQQDVRIGIENCPMFFSQDEWPGGKNLAISPAIWRRMFDAIPSLHFGLNYDPSHLVWQQINWIAPLNEFADRIFHVHAKDVLMDQDRLNQVGIYANPTEFHIPKLPGLGEIEWGRFVGALGEAGYQGPVCVEVEDRVYESSLAARELALQQCYTFLRNYIPRKAPSQLQVDS